MREALTVSRRLRDGKARRTKSPLGRIDPILLNMLYFELEGMVAVYIISAIKSTNFPSFPCLNLFLFFFLLEIDLPFFCTFPEKDPNENSPRMNIGPVSGWSECLSVYFADNLVRYETNQG